MNRASARPGRCLRIAGRALLLAFSLCIASTSVAKNVNEDGELPAISIIIDDLGYRRLEGLRAIELPGPVAYAILPHTPYARRLAGIAFQLDKEVLLHVPMESELDKALGPGALTTRMARLEVKAVLDAGLASRNTSRPIARNPASCAERSATLLALVRLSTK